MILLLSSAKTSFGSDWSGRVDDMDIEDAVSEEVVTDAAEQLTENKSVAE